MRLPERFRTTKTQTAPFVVLQHSISSQGYSGIVQCSARRAGLIPREHRRVARSRIEANALMVSLRARTALFGFKPRPLDCVTENDEL
jgi:hypothetical protein